MSRRPRYTLVCVALLAAMATAGCTAVPAEQGDLPAVERVDERLSSFEARLTAGA